MTISETVLASLEAGILRLTLNRPDKPSSFNEEMYLALRAQVRRAQDDAEVRAVLLTGAGRGLCAGQDLGTLIRARVCRPRIWGERWRPSTIRRCG